MNCGFPEPMQIQAKEKLNRTFQDHEMASGLEPCCITKQRQHNFCSGRLGVAKIKRICYQNSWNAKSKCEGRKEVIERFVWPGELKAKRKPKNTDSPLKPATFWNQCTTRTRIIEARKSRNTIDINWKELKTYGKRFIAFIDELHYKYKVWARKMSQTFLFTIESTVLVSYS